MKRFSLQEEETIVKNIFGEHVPGKHFGRLVCVAFTVIDILEHWAALIFFSPKPPKIKQSITIANAELFLHEI